MIERGRIEYGGRGRCSAGGPGGREDIVFETAKELKVEPLSLSEQPAHSALLTERKLVWQPADRIVQLRH